MYKNTEKYFDAINSVYNGLDSSIDRKPKLLYKGTTASPEWVDKNDPAGKATLADRVAQWNYGDDITLRIELQNSFSESYEQASLFIDPDEGTPIVLETVTNRGVPITSVSYYSSEIEHLMLPKEKYKILNVEQIKIQNEQGYKITIEPVPFIKKVDYEFSL
ncbi:MAG: hypothetical protein LBR53_03975 [Deltaproteobacteria bacterium]|nr:hypothetical protein [Deltaproteobacteria bacterium]